MMQIMAIALALVLAVLQLVPQHLWACTKDIGVGIVAIVNPCVGGADGSGGMSADARVVSPAESMARTSLALENIFEFAAEPTSCCSEQHKKGLELCCVAVDQLATAAPAYVVPDYGPIFVGTLPLPAMTLVPLFEPRTQLHGLPALLPDRQPVLAEPRPPAQLLI